MNLPEHIIHNLKSYLLILVLPFIGWLGVILFFEKIRIVSSLSMIFGLIAFCWSLTCVWELTQKRKLLMWARPIYAIYLLVLFGWGVAISDWVESMTDLIPAMLVLVLINAVVTLLFSWFVVEMLQRHYQKNS